MSDRRIDFEFTSSFGFVDTKVTTGGSINYSPEVGEIDKRITSSVEHAVAQNLAIFHELSPEFFYETFGF